jgi:tRNA(Ile2) C34 agmatinyltransferase TiaS
MTRAGRHATDDRAPICPFCGVTMLAVELSARGDAEGDWVCLECEERGES